MFSFSSCSASAVMDVSRDEAARRLKAGDIGFILSAETSRVNELAKLDPSSPFYAGLLVENARDKRRAAYLFEAALGSPILKVGKESARRLIPLLAELQDPEIANRVLQFMQKNKNAPEEEFVTLKAAAAYVLGRYGEVNSLLRGTESGTAAGLPEHLAAWNRAFQFLAALKQQIPGILPSTETRKFFLDFPAGAASRWAYEEILKSPGYIFPAAERTAVTGRLAVFGGAYSEALVHFESLKNSPLLFQHPLLLGDMGRSYAAVSSKREAGFKLFTDWENALRTGRNSPAPALTEDQVQAVRYTLLFYTGRIRRQQGKHGEAVDYFTRALALTRDTVQEDACIWYILSSTFTEKPETVPALIKTYAPLWNNDDDFYDILDKLSCYLMTEKKWRSLQDVFDYIRNSKDGATVAKYAYLVGRAVSLGYISGREGMDTRDYFTVAYEAGNASFYYRALAASYLGKVVSPTERGRGAGNSAAQYPHRAELEFYAKFFEFGAAPYAMTYLRENADRYTKHELRVAARTFASAGRYLESIQIVGMYMRRDDYVMETVDLELYYPNPFTSLIEKYAQANGLLPQVFFGLIRTESAFIPDIASHAGAVGLAQIMPSTATEIAAIIKKGGGPDFSANGNIDLTDPEINVQMGAVYLKSLTDSLGSPMLALLAYNGGPGRIRRLRRAVPSLPEDLFIETIGISETRNYGKRVMAAAAAYGFLYYGMSMHEVVADIFK